ncbi:hypothetical protein IAT40_000612 [Kwoniella sp. CBS 6097]
MSFAAPDDRQYGNYYPRAPGSAQGPPPPPHPQQHSTASPEQRLHSSGGYPKTGPGPNESPSQQVYQGDIGPPPGSSHGYPPQPITPLSGPTYPPQQPPSGGYYGITQTPQSEQPPQAPAQQHIPSPPPSSSGRPTSGNFTPDGVPIVPVGVSGGKMFRCRGYGECDKVFTRSEHLARHVRKHTGERPFPCHCGKAFSRLDNLRQHAATVHADQGPMNEVMLSSLAPIHAALSSRANKDQRRRGEVVEVPKNAVERPRHAEYRTHNKTSPPGSAMSQQQQQQGSPYAPYHADPSWNVPPPQHARPRTGGYDYPPYGAEGQPPMEDAGPSRRPASSTGYGYQQPPYYDQSTRPPTAPGTASSTDSLSQLPYPYRPMSSQGRDLPVPSHYAESEPPSTAHGPPESPMYANVPSQPQWSSPPPPHSTYPPQDTSAYPPPAEGYSYPPPPHQHGSYPPREDVYSYPQNWTPQQQYSNIPPPPSSAGGYPPASYGQQPPESPFQYNAPGGPNDAQYPPPNYGYDSRKRRVEEDGSENDPRKHARPISGVPDHQAPPQHLNAALDLPRSQQQDPTWLPPASERRSSLAISALLGSPHQTSRSRPVTAGEGYDHAQAAYQASQAYESGGAQDQASAQAQSMPPTPAINGAGARKGRENVHEDVQSMEQKAKALLGQGR